MVDECVNDCNITYKVNHNIYDNDDTYESKSNLQQQQQQQQQQTIPDRNIQQRMLSLACENMGQICAKIIRLLREFLELDKKDVEEGKLAIRLTQKLVQSSISNCFKYQGVLQFFGYLGLVKYQHVLNNEHFLVLPRNQHEMENNNIKNSNKNIDHNNNHDDMNDNNKQEDLDEEKIQIGKTISENFDIHTTTQYKTENNANDSLPQRTDIIDPILLSYAFRAVHLCKRQCMRYTQNIEDYDFTSLLNLIQSPTTIENDNNNNNDESKDENKLDIDIEIDLNDNKNVSNDITITTNTTDNNVPSLLSPEFQSIVFKDPNGIICTTLEDFDTIVSSIGEINYYDDVCIVFEEFLPFLDKFSTDDRYRILYLSNKSVVRKLLRYTSQTLDILALLGYEWKDSKCDTLICKVAPPRAVIRTCYGKLHSYLEMLTRAGFNPTTNVDENGRFILSSTDEKDKDKDNDNDTENKNNNKPIAASKYYAWYSYVVMVLYVVNCILSLLVLNEFNNPKFGNKYIVLFYIGLSCVLLTQVIYLATLWLGQLKLFKVRDGQIRPDGQTWYHKLGLVLLSIVCSSAIPIILYFAKHKHSKLRLNYLVKLGYKFKSESFLDSSRNYNDVIRNMVEFNVRVTTHHVCLRLAAIFQFLPLS